MRQHLLMSILGELNGSSDDIFASSVLSSDGLTVATALAGAPPQDLDEDKLGAMGAAMLALGHRAAIDLVGSGLDQVLVTGQGGCILITHAGPDLVLAVLARSGTASGMIFSDMQRAANDIEALAGSTGDLVGETLKHRTG
jgi:predicted regulator of Ras-like GTPase activity (Roadblock/LC7/MglB family)